MFFHNYLRISLGAIETQINGSTYKSTVETPAGQL